MADRLELSKASMKQTRRTNDEYIAVLHSHRGGESRKDIAARLGVSQERVRQILVKAERFERQLNDPFAGLGVRAKNCIRAAGCESVTDLYGLLMTTGLDGLQNLGKVTKKEIITWMNERI